MKVLLLSRYGRLGASSRVRSLQYLPFIEQQDIHTDISPLFSDKYVSALYSGRSRWGLILSGYWKRIKILFKAGSYDLIWIEKEVFPYLPAFAERFFSLMGIVYIVDYDDAIFHNYDRHRYWFVRALLGRKIDVVMRSSNLVIAGNDYLATRARTAGASWVEIIPTVVDVDRYEYKAQKNTSELVVGWIGSPSTQRYLQTLLPVFERLKNEFDIRFIAVGANQADLKKSVIEAKPWTEETESSIIQLFDIGIMPLTDTEWELGKCGYKLIQYMACGIPVIASEIGVNKKIVNNGVNGYLVNDLSEWERMLRALITSDSDRKNMGAAGYKLVHSWYSVQVQAPRLATLFHQVVNR